MNVSLWRVLLLASVFFLSGGCHEDCLLPLGMEDGGIKDENIRATSALRLAKAKNARLNHDDGYGGWCPNQNQTKYKNKTSPVYVDFIQIKFVTPLRVKGILTQGRATGVEKVERYKIAYQNSKEGEKYAWYFGGMNQELTFKHNKLPKLQENILRPPIVTHGIRIVPGIDSKKQVCLRLELLGCPLKDGLVMYNIFLGNTMGEYNFTDSIYDGLVKGNSLSSGLGMLTDGHLAPANYVDTLGIGWIGWNAKDTPNPYIMFEFLSTRIFYSVTVHCNVRDEADVKLFSRITVRFKGDASDATFNKSLTHKSKQISSGTGWKNYNVTVDLCKNVGKFMEFKFAYAGDWILISEVTFSSEPLDEKFPPSPVCAIIPPLSTKSSTGPGVVNTTNSPSDSFEGNTGGTTGTGSGSLNGGVIAAIICSVVVVLVVVALFICCKRYPHWFSQREKPFNSFIKVEVKPYARYEGSQRVSRLDSTASENQEKTGSFKNNVHNEAAQKRGGAEVTISPIYASIQDALNKGTMKSDEQNNIPKGERHYSEHKPLKKDKRPIPPPLKPPEPPSEVIYAEPNTPLLLSSTSGGSPKPATPQNIPQVDLMEESDAAYSDYAEPDSPCEKNRLIPNSPQPRVVSGYADPIDVISPTSLNTFPNPIYEEIYSEPFQGVTGTSMYCNPDEEQNFRPRLDTFKELPRNKFHFKEKIGDGQFGEVYIGEVERLGDILGGEFKNSPRTTVAIKTLKVDVDKNIKDDFFKEVKAMAGLKHSNVIRLLGVCRDDPMCMIVEYMANGDLNQFLKERELTPSWSENDGWQDAGQYISLQALFLMAKQVAAGMKYISSLNYVHRDLATRNCLVGHAYTVKIADFGMSRNLYAKHYYRVEGRVILPIRWMAPECILQGRFTTSSDVWAFGVTLWEILSLAKEYPYSELTDEEVIDNAQKIFHGTGKPSTRLLQPGTCPDDLYQLMCRCWTREMEERPSFMELHSNIAERVRLSEVSMNC